MTNIKKDRVQQLWDDIRDELKTTLNIEPSYGTLERIAYSVVQTTDEKTEDGYHRKEDIKRVIRERIEYALIHTFG